MPNEIAHDTDPLSTIARLEAALARMTWERDFWRSVADGMERERQKALSGNALCTHQLVDGRCVWCNQTT